MIKYFNLSDTSTTNLTAVKDKYWVLKAFNKLQLFTVAIIYCIDGMIISDNICIRQQGEEVKMKLSIKLQKGKKIVYSICKSGCQFWGAIFIQQESFLIA